MRALVGRDGRTKEEWLPGQGSNLRKTVVNSHPLYPLSYRGMKRPGGVEPTLAGWGPAASPFGQGRKRKMRSEGFEPPPTG